MKMMTQYALHCNKSIMVDKVLRNVTPCQKNTIFSSDLLQLLCMAAKRKICSGLQNVLKIA